MLVLIGLYVVCSCLRERTSAREFEQASLKANDVPRPQAVTKALVLAKTPEENVNWAYELKPE